MKHTGSCTKTCGHKLDFGHVLASPTNSIDDIEDGGVIEFVYASSRPVAAIHKAIASQLRITELS